MHRLEIQRLAAMALSEDLVAGDLTTDATIPADVQARGRAVAKSPLVVCAGELFATVFRNLDPQAQCEQLLADGTLAEPGQVLWQLQGNARALLQAERSALNLVQRACGIATLTRRFVQQLPAGSSARITDTRKTTPGLRLLERYAVRMGGGYNHRDNLGAAVLIKDNHIAVAGGVSAAIARARHAAPHTTRIEVEVSDLGMLDEALQAGADIVMLDNFELADVQEAARRARGRTLLEVSGGVTLQRVAELANAGVDVISVGALTHSAPAADISLQLQCG